MTDSASRGPSAVINAELRVNMPASRVIHWFQIKHPSKDVPDWSLLLLRQAECSTDLGDVFSTANWPNVITLIIINCSQSAS